MVLRRLTVSPPGARKWRSRLVRLVRRAPSPRDGELVIEGLGRPDRAQAVVPWAKHHTLVNHDRRAALRAGRRRGRMKDVARGMALAVAHAFPFARGALLLGVHLARLTAPVKTSAAPNAKAPSSSGAGAAGQSPRRVNCETRPVTSWPPRAPAPPAPRARSPAARDHRSAAGGRALVPGDRVSRGRTVPAALAVCAAAPRRRRATCR